MNNAVHENIAENIRALRTARGWSVRQLAEECAKRGTPTLTQASLANIERRNGEAAGRVARRVDVAELVFLAELFGVTPNDLFAKWETCPRCHGAGTVRVGGAS